MDTTPAIDDISAVLARAQAAPPPRPARRPLLSPPSHRGLTREVAALRDPLIELRDDLHRAVADPSSDAARSAAMQADAILNDLTLALRHQGKR